MKTMGRHFSWRILPYSTCLIKYFHCLYTSKRNYARLFTYLFGISSSNRLELPPILNWFRKHSIQPTAWPTLQRTWRGQWWNRHCWWRSRREGSLWLDSFLTLWNETLMASILCWHLLSVHAMWHLLTWNDFAVGQSNHRRFCFCPWAGSTSTACLSFMMDGQFTFCKLLKTIPWSFGLTSVNYHGNAEFSAYTVKWHFWERPKDDVGASAAAKPFGSVVQPSDPLSFHFLLWNVTW